MTTQLPKQLKNVVWIRPSVLVHKDLCQAHSSLTDGSCQRIHELLHLFQKGERHTFHRRIELHVQTHFFDGVFVVAIAGFVLHHVASYNRLQERYLSNQMFIDML